MSRKPRQHGDARAESPGGAFGLTQTERFLGHLCKGSFLSLWTYPSIYRDQRAHGSGDGKEICDVLVVFDDDIILFSDKDCEFPQSDDLNLDWSRWFRRSIWESAKQITGAERWIRNFPNRLFLDRACSIPFPLVLPDISKARFHRIVVAHASAHRCRDAVHGSGSLRIRTNIRGSAHLGRESTPFMIGDLTPDNGFVHVIDDNSLELVLGTLSTTADFVSYLRKKEAFVRSNVVVSAESEEDLLALYLSDINADGEHDFIFPRDAQDVAVPAGLWKKFSNSSDRLWQLIADSTSYIWDQIVEKCAGHVFDGTALDVYGNPEKTISNAEIAIRWLAKEGRTVRRLLATSLLGLIQEAPSSPRMRATRIMPPPRNGSPYYAFLILGNIPELADNDYRQLRRGLLEAICKVVKLNYPDAQHIVGFATEPRGVILRSEDIGYLDARNWNDEMQRDAQELKDQLGLLTNLKESFRTVEYEYPRPRP